MISVWALMAMVAGILLLLAWVGWWFFARTSMAAPVARAPAFGWVAGSCRRLAASVSQRMNRVMQALQAGAWRAIALSIGTLLGVLVVAFALGGLIRVDPAAALPGVFGSRIGQAFAPEELVAPPPLPPDLFVSIEDPGLQTADRDWNKLDAGFRQALLHLIERAQQRGVELVLLEGYRSPERQTHLASLGSNVTRAGAFQSKHQFGTAADLAPLRDGQLMLHETDAWVSDAYRVLGEEAERLGLTWGGRWTLRDLGHVELAGAALARRP